MATESGEPTAGEPKVDFRASGDRLRATRRARAAAPASEPQSPVVAEPTVAETSLIGGSGTLPSFGPATEGDSLASVIEGAASDADTAAVQEAMPDPTPAVEASAAETPAQVAARVEEESPNPEADEKASENGGFVLTRIPDGVKGVGDKTRAALQAMGPGRVFGTELELADALRKQAKVVKPVEVVEALVGAGAFEPVEEAEGYRFPVDLTTNKIAGIGPKTARELEGRVLTHDQLKSIARSNAKKIETGLADAGIEYRTPAYVAHQDEIRSLQDIDPDTLEGGEVEDKKSFLNFVDKRGESTVRILDARIAGWREADVDQAAMALDQELGGDPDSTTPSNLSKASVVVGREYERRHPKPVAEVAAEPAVEEAQDQAVEGPTGFEPIDHLDNGTTPGIGRLRDEVLDAPEVAELAELSFDDLLDQGNTLIYNRRTELAGRIREFQRSKIKTFSLDGLRTLMDASENLRKQQKENRANAKDDADIAKALRKLQGRNDPSSTLATELIEAEARRLEESSRPALAEKAASGYKINTFLMDMNNAHERKVAESLLADGAELDSVEELGREFQETLTFLERNRQAQEALENFRANGDKQRLLEEARKYVADGVVLEPKGWLQKIIAKAEEKANPKLAATKRSMARVLEEEMRLTGAVTDLSDVRSLRGHDAPSLLRDVALMSGQDRSYVIEGNIRVRIVDMLDRHINGVSDDRPEAPVSGGADGGRVDAESAAASPPVDDDSPLAGVASRTDREDEVDRLLADLGGPVEQVRSEDAASEAGLRDGEGIPQVVDTPVERPQAEQDTRTHEEIIAAFERAYDVGDFRRDFKNSPTLKEAFGKDLAQIGEVFAQDDADALLKEYIEASNNRGQTKRRIGIGLDALSKRSDIDITGKEKLASIADSLGLDEVRDVIRSAIRRLNG